METSSDTRGTRYHINLGHNSRPSIEQVPVLAGREKDNSMVIVEREATIGGLLGIEVLMPTRVIRNGSPDGCDLEFKVGTPNPNSSVVTVTDGVAFDGTDYGQYPGIEADYTPNQELVAIRVENTRLNRTND